jgi:hypothetical protein
MTVDIGPILSSWPYDPDGVTARLIVGDDGAPQLQLRLDTGVLQMALEGRPDGEKPNSRGSWLAWLDSMQRRKPGRPLREADWAELDREIVQFYHRRIALLATAQSARSRKNNAQALDLYRRVVHDADHNLRAMDFIAAHSSDQPYIDGHERYRAFVLAHRTQAAAYQRMLEGDPEQAIEQLGAGIARIEQVHRQHGLEALIEQDPMLLHLRAMDRTVRRQQGIEQTLREQLEQAIKDEDYERAARIRDRMQRRQTGPKPEG